MTDERQDEFRGKTVEAAISAGLAALRLSRHEVDVEVVRPGSRGVLGIGAEDAVVRLIPARRAQAEPKPVSKPRPASPPAAPPVDLAPHSGPEPLEQATAPGVEAWLPEAGDGKATAGVETGRDVLVGLLERLGLKADVEIVPQSDAESDEGERGLVLNIVGEDLEALIGRQNETLSALELITRLMANQQSHARTAFSVDVNGYRAKRAESLRRLALRMAEQAIETGRTVVLEPMSPAERRIIHLALRDSPTVDTQSIGEGDHRKVTVVPKRS